MAVYTKSYTAWQNFPTVTTPITAAKLQNVDDGVSNVDTMYRRHLVDVRDYGAAGDGSADDTNAITAAQAAARSTSGWVFFPMGRYKITATLTLQENDKWVGGTGNGRTGPAYPLASIIEWHGTAGGTMVQPSDTTIFTDYVQLEDIFFSGNLTAGVALYMPSCRDWTIQRCQFNYCTVAGVKTWGQRTPSAGLNPGDCTKNLFIHCQFLRGLTGCLLGGTPGYSASISTTFAANVAATATSITCAGAASGFSSPIVTSQGESITFTGTSASTSLGNGVFTGCTRGDQGTTRAAYGVTGTDMIYQGVRINGGTSNMNTFLHCLFANSDGPGLYIAQGAANCLVRPLFDSCGSTSADGCRIGWYGNSILGGVIESVTGYAINIQNFDTAHDNLIWGVHSGAGNTLGDYSDPQVKSTYFSLNPSAIGRTGGIIVAHGTSANIANEAMWNNAGTLTWRDNTGADHALY